VTTNGKKVEVPIKKVLGGVSADKAGASTLANPDALRWFENRPELRLPAVKAKL
jgi:acetoacetyl-CoA synthetase